LPILAAIRRALILVSNSSATSPKRDPSLAEFSDVLLSWLAEPDGNTMPPIRDIDQASSSGNFRTSSGSFTSRFAALIGRLRFARLAQESGRRKGSSLSAQWFRELRNIRRDPPCPVFGEQPSLQWTLKLRLHRKDNPISTKKGILRCCKA
jgi:hypothetical protein